MVCLGNICRSPMAEGILRQRAREMNLAIETDSSGTSGFHQGEKPDDRAIETLKRKGIDISDLRSRLFTIADFENFDHILVMDEFNYKDVLVLSSDEEQIQKVKLMMDYAPNLGTNIVPDPYFGSIKEFEEVFELLDVACKNFLLSIK